MKKLLSIISFGAMTAFASQSMASVMYEVGDAGETLGTAQAVAGGTSQIQGSVSGDADLFSFFWGGGSFYVNTVGSTFDSQLFLFDSTGAGVWGNDDGIAFAGPAYISDANLAAGQYYLGVSGYNYDPYSASGLIFDSYPYDPVYGPNNTAPLSYWSGGSGSGSYSINFQQITSSGDPVGDPTPTGVPAPLGGGLLALGLMAMGTLRARKG